MRTMNTSPDQLGVLSENSERPLFAVGSEKLILICELRK